MNLLSAHDFLHITHNATGLNSTVHNDCMIKLDFVLRDKVFIAHHTVCTLIEIFRSGPLCIYTSPPVSFSLFEVVGCFFFSSYICILNHISQFFLTPSTQYTRIFHIDVNGRRTIYAALHPTLSAEVRDSAISVLISYERVKIKVK